MSYLIDDATNQLIDAAANQLHDDGGPEADFFPEELQGESLEGLGPNHSLMQ
jgi:hypothetical protein